jgi:hypothetical protein
MADCCVWNLFRGDFDPHDETIFPEKHSGAGGQQRAEGKKPQRGES